MARRKIHRLKLDPRSKFAALLDGMASVLDIGATRFHCQVSADPFGDDAKALRGDWYQVGSDILDAAEALRHEE